MSGTAGGRLLVTGASGFVGRHVVAAAAAAGHEVVAAVRAAPSEDLGRALGASRVETGVDLADGERLAAVVRGARPDAVIHLAGFAHVGWSHGDPAGAIAANAAGSAALLSAVAAEAAEARVVLASTSEVYGRSAEPLHEAGPLAPESPYGWSKLWMEQTAGYFRERHGLSIGVVRSFAHCGAVQGPAFAMSNFARQVAEARLAGRGECVVRTGNRSTIRDLSDVRDAARAYLLVAGAAVPGVPSPSAGAPSSAEPPSSVAAAARHASPAELPDGPINVGSGRGVSTADVVAAVGAAAGVAVDHVEGPELVRAGENPRIVADVSLAAQLLGWRPEWALADTAAAAVDHWLGVLERDPSQGTGVYG